MSENTKVSRLEAIIAAQSISRILDGRTDVPVNSDFFRWQIESVNTDNTVWFSMYTMLKLLKENYEELLQSLEIFTSVETLIAYLDSIRYELLELIASREVEADIEILKALLEPVIAELKSKSKVETATQIENALADLLTQPFDAAMRLYQQLQIAKELDVITEEVAAQNLTKVYEKVTVMVHEAMAARLNHTEWQHQPKEA